MTKPSTPNPATLPPAGEGAHEKARDEQIRSRSADPGQSSYGGFKGEDPRRQAEDLSKNNGPDSPSKK